MDEPCSAPWPAVTDLTWCAIEEAAATDLTWRAIEEAALHDEVLHAAVHYVRHRQLTREQALIFAVLALSRARQGLHDQLLERLMNEPATDQTIGRP